MSPRALAAKAAFLLLRARRPRRFTRSPFARREF